MESHGATAKPGIPKLTLETYLNLMHLDVIAPSVLRKIISMHGFKSGKVKKNDLLDAVRSIDLMDVHRSTLQSDGVSSNAFLSLKDVISDLSALQWHECCITSIETINSANDDCCLESSPKRLKLTANLASSPERLKLISNLASCSEDINNETTAYTPYQNARKHVDINVGPEPMEDEAQPVPLELISVHSGIDRPKRNPTMPARYLD